jgi:hypothetical protein
MDAIYEPNEVVDIQRPSLPRSKKAVGVAETVEPAVTYAGPTQDLTDLGYGSKPILTSTVRQNGDRLSLSRAAPSGRHRADRVADQSASLR